MFSTINKRIKLIVFFLIAIFLIVFIMESALRLMYPTKYEEFVFKYSEEYNVDPYLVFAIIKAESGFNKNAQSHRNAKGLMQIIESTGNWAADNIGIDDFSPEMLFAPEINIQIGCWYISNLSKQFNNNLDLILAAYNGGSGNVKRWLSNPEYSLTGEDLYIIPFKETENYLARVKNFYAVYKKIYEKTSLPMIN